MQLGNSLNLDGHAAYVPSDTYAHPIASSFASAIGFDAEGKVVNPDVPMSGPSNGNVGTSDFRSGAR